MKTRQIGRCQKHVEAMRNLIAFFLIDFLLKNGSFVSERDLAMSNNIQFLLLFSKL